MFDAEGLNVPSLLRDAGFDPESLHRQNARIPVDEITMLWQLAIGQARHSTLGLRRARAAPPPTRGPLGRALASSGDLGMAYRLAARYMAVLSDATAFSVEHEALGAWLAIEHIGGRLPIPRQRVEYAFLTTLVQSCWLTRRDIQPLAMEFAYPAPANDRPYREAFACPVRFDAPANRMLVSATDLALPLPTHHPVLAEIQEQLLEDQLVELGQTTTSTLVCAEIARRLSHGEPRRQDVASGLGLADRTLQRRLQEESMSFQMLLDRTRRELAQQYLAQERHSLTDVADLLGFVDRSNFFRACKRWFGLPPAQYRVRLWQGDSGDSLLRAAA